MQRSTPDTPLAAFLSFADRLDARASAIKEEKGGYRAGAGRSVGRRENEGRAAFGGGGTGLPARRYEYCLQPNAAGANAAGATPAAAGVLYDADGVAWPGAAYRGRDSRRARAVQGQGA